MSTSTPAPPQFSADGRWWWDGTQWVPVATPRRAPPPTGTGLRWARRIFSIVAGGVALLVLLGLLLVAVTASPIDPVSREGTLTKLVRECHVPGDTGDECAYLDIDSFCYRIAPNDFQPPLPDLSTQVGKSIVLIVDRTNYESSRTIGDPYCNFQVTRVVLTESGDARTYSTAAMNGPQFAGHPVGDTLRVVVIPLIVLIALAGWNISREVRLRRRR